MYKSPLFQLCIVHQIRNSCQFVPYKDRKAVCAEIYAAVNLDDAEFAKMFSENPDALFVTDLKHAQWSDNFEGYINLMKFTLGV